MNELLDTIRAGGPLMAPLGILCAAISYWTVAIRLNLRGASPDCLPRFEREAVILKAMVAAAPLLGLLGTVKGMIATFAGLAERGAETMELLSSGVSEALVTTQVGLVVALPGLVGLYTIQRKLRSLEARLGGAPSTGGVRP